MLRFVDVGREFPHKRTASERVEDFKEIYAEFAGSRAAEQAARCSQCGVPYCQVHCPLSNNIPDWLKLTAEGRLEEAYRLSQATNPLPEICGRICPQDRLCEGSCTIEQSGHGTVTIGAIERYLTDTAWNHGWVRPLTPRTDRGQSVGIIGAGPAGLAAAEALRQRGYRVTVYDRHDRAGGLLTYGIPGFKLEKSVVQRRIDRLVHGGIEFTLNFEVGRNASLEDLRGRHDALFIATGVYKARDLKVPGVDLGHIVPALDYLITSNRRGFGDSLPKAKDKALNAHGKKVAVIGGGDTAMDCVRTALRQGAVSVSCLYRRDRDNMPGSLREVAHAEEEGVHFEWLTLPTAFQGTRNVEAVRLVRQRLGLADPDGRRAPEAIAGSEFSLDVDLAISALGFEPEDLPGLFSAPQLATRSSGTLRVAPKTMMTSIEGVFAGGDVVRGASLVVWAVRDGLDAAEAIDRFLLAQKATPAQLAAE
ncbi:MAG: NAD(P)-dependent oxidoreductase [Alphaproteobacteria bacterium]|nr:NAD(P)-dependent oxidoreductase [Alphaproteobacteria bacterium]